MKHTLSNPIITALTALYLTTTGVAAFSQTDSKSDTTTVDKQDSAKTTQVVAFKPECNVLETAATLTLPSDTYKFRTRALVNDAVKIGPIDLGYNSLHEMNNLDLKTYFSRNSINVGVNGMPTKACAILTVTSNGLVDVKYGLRNTNLFNLLGFDYGWIEATFNQKSGDITAFAGKDLGKKVNLELFNTTDIPYSGGFKNYSEIQLNTTLTKHLKAFGRAEFSKGNLKAGTYLVGLSANL